LVIGVSSTAGDRIVDRLPNAGARVIAITNRVPDNISRPKPTCWQQELTHGYALFPILTGKSRD